MERGSCRSGRQRMITISPNKSSLLEREREGRPRGEPAATRRVSQMAGGGGQPAKRDRTAERREKESRESEHPVQRRIARENGRASPAAE